MVASVSRNIVHLFVLKLSLPQAQQYPVPLVTKLQNSNCVKNQILKLWQNSKTQIETKLKNLNCDKTKNLNYDKSQIKIGLISKTQIVTKLKRSNCDKTHKLMTKLKNSLGQNSNWQNPKYQIVTKTKIWQNQIVTKLKKIYQTKKLKLWQNSKTQIVTKLKSGQNSKSQIMTKLQKL